MLNTPPVTAQAVHIALIGVGQFGQSLIAQSLAIPQLNLNVLCDLDCTRIIEMCSLLGIDSGTLARCESLQDAQTALLEKKIVVTDDRELVPLLPVDMVVEATGNPEIAAHNTLAAFQQGRHVAMVSKETDSVIGPILCQRAQQEGLVYTPVDGDQPNLLLNLLGWVQKLGLDVVAAGKSSEYDFIFDPLADTISWRDRTISVPGFAKLWQLPSSQRLDDFIAERSQQLANLPQRTVPDLCEMGIVANASSLSPDVPGFHLPLSRTIEVPNIFRPQQDGGLLRRRGVIDVFNCLRRADEASFAGGVFVIVACQDKSTWQVLKEKGIPVSDDGNYALLYNPQHLLGVEAPITLLNACQTGNTTVQQYPRFDLVARTMTDFAAGQKLTITDAHHHEVANLEPQLVPAQALSDDTPVPYYLATGRILKNSLPKGAIIRCKDIDLDTDSIVWQLREEQDRVFIKR